MLKFFTRFKKENGSKADTALKYENLKLKEQLELFKQANLKLAQQLATNESHVTVTEEPLPINDQIKFVYLRCLTAVVDNEGSLTVPVYDGRLACHKSFYNNPQKQLLRELLSTPNQANFYQIEPLLCKMNYAVEFDTRYSQERHNSYTYATITKANTTNE